MIRRLYVLAVLAIVASPARAHALFRDVPSRHANLEAIQYVETQGMVSGYLDGTYKPDQVINRAEFTKIIIGAVATQEELRSCNINNLMRYGDIAGTDWFARYVCVGTVRGIIQGHLVTGGKAQFRPAEDINFVAASKILVGAFGIGEPPMNCDGENSVLCMQAAARGDIWYKRHVLALEERNAIPLSITSFQDGVTRGEMAEMIYRLHAGISSKQSRSYEQLESPATTPVSPPSEWDTYRNDVVGYSMQYSPESGGMGSNTFGIWEPSCAIAGRLGPLDISLYARSEANSDGYFTNNRKQKLLPASERIEVVRQLNAEGNPHIPNKRTAHSVESLRIDGKTAHRFWTTESVDGLGGGYLAEGMHYVVYVDVGDLMFEMSYSAEHEGEVQHMFTTWKNFPARFTTGTLYDAAQECQNAK